MIEHASNAQPKETLCPACGADDKQHMFPISWGRLVTCKKCKLVLLDPLPEIEELVRFYENSSYRDAYRSGVMTQANFAEKRYSHLLGLIKQFIPQLIGKEKRSLLDIGCGVGSFLSVAQANNWSVLGTEISHEAVCEANKVLGDRVFEGDISSLALSDTFDLITIYHVVEHLLNPVEVLTKAYQLLQSNGILFVETPNIGGIGARLKQAKWSMIKPPEHVLYYKPCSLKYVLRKAGFSKIKIFTTTPTTLRSIADFSPSIRLPARLVYQLASSLGIGPILQAMAFK